MSVPKNFNSTVNLKNRVDSLNDLTFFTVKYDYELTDDYEDKLHKDFDVDTEITGVKEVSGLDEEQVIAKIENWFIVLSDRGILKSFEIKSVESRSFYETLKDKKILDIIELKNPR